MTFRQRPVLLSPFRHPKRAGGFTLTEVLITVAILGFLAVVLMPVFLSARERSRRSVCAGNLGQLYKAVAMYAGDNDGFRPMYPVGAGTSSDRTDGRAVTWPDQSAELVQCLLPYTRSTGVWYCPDDPLPGKTGVARHPATSYACQTAFVVLPSGLFTPLPLVPAGRDAATTFLFADDILSCKPGLPDTFLYTHGQWFNVVFSDGHVGTKSAQDGNADGDCYRH